MFSIFFNASLHCARQDLRRPEGRHSVTPTFSSNTHVHMLALEYQASLLTRSYALALYYQALSAAIVVPLLPVFGLLLFNCLFPLLGSTTGGSGSPTRQVEMGGI